MVTGEVKRFSSKILAPWCRKSPKVSEVLPLLCLHGLSSGDFVPAMEQWTDDHTALKARGLSVDALGRPAVLP